jgi:hypothetical protein
MKRRARAGNGGNGGGNEDAASILTRFIGKV